MIRKLLTHISGSALARGQQGYAFVLLIAFMALAVPLTLAALRMSVQLNRDSRVFDEILKRQYSSNCGLELALWRLLNDPSFDTGLTPDSPTRQITLDCNGQSVTLNITKIFSGALAGQGLRVTKTVTPGTASPGVGTTYTYTISIENAGTDTDRIKEIRDLLPGGFTYESGSSGGLSTSNPNITVQNMDQDQIVVYLNDAAGNPRPWSSQQGSGSAEAEITPAQSTWTTLPEYWEIGPLPPGQISSGQWEQEQWWYTTRTANRWRWKVQRVQGAVVTDLFTSPDSSFDSSTQWKLKQIQYNAGIITIQDGDILRLRLEVYSNDPDASDRLFSYRWGGAEGATDYDSRTEMRQFTQSNCGTTAEELRWSISPNVDLDSGQLVTQTFQASASKPDGTYYNQAWVRYVPWWDTSDVEQHTPPTAPVTVGTGQPSCAAGILVSKSVVPLDAPIGVESIFTYTISIQNTTPFAVPINKVHDLLPPTFTFVTGSSIGLWPYAPSVSWDVDLQRWHLVWDVDGAASVGANSTVVQTFQARATPEQGLDYHNDAWAEWDEQSCISCPPDQGSAFTGSSATVLMPRLYDIQVIAGNGQILARVELSALGDQVTILSYQGQ